MALFKRKHLLKIVAGEKTQTRRTHVREWKVGKTYGLRDRWFTAPQGHITITRKFRQRLGEISEADVRAEGYSNLAEFQKAWEEIYGPWDPQQIVTAYEFKTARKTDSNL